MGGADRVSLAVFRASFAGTILFGSFLLFCVQPLVARMVLPLLGGAPMVWNSAMLVFQTLLLAGYAYAHALSKLPARRAALVHIALLVVALASLPIAIRVPLTPQGGLAVLATPLILFATVGPVFALVAAQASLLQRWFGHAQPERDPYWLYAASNLGSFTGLLAYPLLFEPNLPLADQSRLWGWGYGALIVLTSANAWLMWRIGAGNAGIEDAVPEPLERRRALTWLALAAVPSGLMLSTTTHLTTDIVAAPLLWVIPLGLYLLSFVLAFESRSELAAILVRTAPVILLLAGGMAMVGRGTGNLSVAVAMVLLLFVVATALHRRLYALRPEPEGLTRFYLIVALGGALGGVFAALLAPLLFDWVWEHPLLLLAAGGLLPRIGTGWLERRLPDPRFRRTVEWTALVIAALVAVAMYYSVQAEMDGLVLIAMLIVAACGLLLYRNRPAFVLVLLALMLGRGGFATLGDSIEGARERSYFGVYSVRDNTDYPGFRGLTHGTTLHGLQAKAADRASEPTTYYGRTSGAGLALQALEPEADVAVVGLGVGTLACYAKPGQDWTFYELDPLVVDYAREDFSYLSRCTPRAEVRVGDARVMLGREGTARYDALVIDAFSSDAIPTHLLTREAFDLYRERMAQDGLLVLHISNRFMDLRPMIAALASEARLAGALRSDEGARELGTTGSLWVVLSADVRRVASIIESAPGLAWHRLPPPSPEPWTDDFAPLLPFIEWQNVLSR